MEFQIDAQNNKAQAVRVGQNDREVAHFRKASFLIHNLKGKGDWADYAMKLPAPWTQFRYWLLHRDQPLASAKKTGRMYAFEPDRPYVRHRLVEFAIDLQGQAMRLTPEDRHGLNYVLTSGDTDVGRLSMRTFESQSKGSWHADLLAPADWTPALAAFVAWLAREGRRGMS